MPVQGTPKFDTVALGQLTVDFMRASPAISAKVAYVDSRTGSTHGYTTCQVWSPEVLEKLGELRLLLERDVALRSFESIQEEASDQPLPGLGEHFADGAPPA